jgi:hypothetical protein
MNEATVILLVSAFEDGMGSDFFDRLPQQSLTRRFSMAFNRLSSAFNEDGRCDVLFSSSGRINGTEYSGIASDLRDVTKLKL